MARFKQLFRYSSVLLTGVAAMTAFLATSQPTLAADEVIRHPIPNSNFPIALAVEVPVGKTVVYVSGTVPGVKDSAADPNSLKAYGDTRDQTVSVFEAIEASLKSLNLTMADVIKLQVFLVGDPAKNNKMDFAGFMQGYTQFFGTSTQPNLPARSVLQIAGLANPGWLVEIEATAVRP